MKANPMPWLDNYMTELQRQQEMRPEEASETVMAAWASGGAERLREQLQMRLQLETLRNHDVKYNLGLAEERSRVVEQTKRSDDFRSKFLAAQERIAEQEKENAALREGQDYLLLQYEDLGKQYHKKVQETMDFEDKLAATQAKVAISDDRAAASEEKLMASLERTTAMEQSVQQTVHSVKNELKSELQFMETRLKEREQVLKEREATLLAEAEIFRNRLQDLEHICDSKDALVHRLEGQVEFARTSLEQAVATNTRLEEKQTAAENALVSEKEAKTALELEVKKLEEAVQRGAQLYVDACSELENANHGNPFALHIGSDSSQLQVNQKSEAIMLQNLLQQKEHTLSQAIAEKLALGKKLDFFEVQYNSLLHKFEDVIAGQQQQHEQMEGERERLMHEREADKQTLLDREHSLQMQEVQMQHLQQQVQVLGRSPFRPEQLAMPHSVTATARISPQRQRPNTPPSSQPYPTTVPVHTLGQSDIVQAQWGTSRSNVRTPGFVPDQQQQQQLQMGRSQWPDVNYSVTALAGSQRTLPQHSETTPAWQAEPPRTPTDASTRTVFTPSPDILLLRQDLHRMQEQLKQHLPRATVNKAEQTAPREASGSPSVNPLAMKMQAAIAELQRLSSPERARPALVAVDAKEDIVSNHQSVHYDPPENNQKHSMTLWGGILRGRLHNNLGSLSTLYQNATLNLLIDVDSATNSLISDPSLMLPTKHTYYNVNGMVECFSEVAKLTYNHDAGFAADYGVMMQDVHVDENVSDNTGESICLVTASWSACSTKGAGSWRVFETIYYVKRQKTGDCQVVRHNISARLNRPVSVSKRSQVSDTACTAGLTHGHSLPDIDNVSRCTGVTAVSAAQAHSATPIEVRQSANSILSATTPVFPAEIQPQTQHSVGELSLRTGERHLAADEIQELHLLRKQVVSPENIEKYAELTELRNRVIQLTMEISQVRDLELAVLQANLERDNALAEVEKAKDADSTVQFWQAKVRQLVHENESLKQDTAKIKEHLIEYDINISRDTPGTPTGGGTNLGELAHTVGNLAESAQALSSVRQQRDRLRDELSTERHRNQEAITEMNRLRSRIEEQDQQMQLAKDDLRRVAEQFKKQEQFLEERILSESQKARRSETQATTIRDSTASLLAEETVKREEADNVRRILQQKLQDSDRRRIAAEQRVSELEVQLQSLMAT